MLVKKLKNTAALSLGETKGTHSSLEAVYGAGKGSVAGDAVPDSHG